MVIVINKWAHLSPSLFPSTDLLFLRLHRGSRPPEISSRSSKVIAGPLHVYFLDFFSAFDRFEAGFPRAWFVFPIWIAFRFWFVTVWLPWFRHCGATRVGIWCSRVGKKEESRLFCGTLGVGRIRFENFVFDLRGITCSECDLRLRYGSWETH